MLNRVIFAGICLITAATCSQFSLSESLRLNPMTTWIKESSAAKFDFNHHDRNANEKQSIANHRSILVAIDGTNYGTDHSQWLRDQRFPNGIAETKNNRLLSHVWNFIQDYGEAEDRSLYLESPRTHKRNTPQEFVDRSYAWINQEYWIAKDAGLEPKIDIVGSSIGGAIAHEVAWRINNDGLQKPNSDQVDRVKIRFLGLYDPVQWRELCKDFMIPKCVECSAVGFATNFAGNSPDQVSRHYWTRIHGNNATQRRGFAATHSALIGAPTYADDGPTSWNQNAYPMHWQEGYSDERDIAGSISVDQWIRDQAQAVAIPIPDVDNYSFDNLHPISKPNLQIDG